MTHINIRRKDVEKNKDSFELLFVVRRSNE